MWKYLSEPKGRRSRETGNRYSGGDVWEDDAPHCAVGTLGRLNSCAWCLFISAVMA